MSSPLRVGIEPTILNYYMLLFVGCCAHGCMGIGVCVSQSSLKHFTLWFWVFVRWQWYQFPFCQEFCDVKFMNWWYSWCSCAGSLAASHFRHCNGWGRSRTFIMELRFDVNDTMIWSVYAIDICYSIFNGSWIIRRHRRREIKWGREKLNDARMRPRDFQLNLFQNRANSTNISIFSLRIFREKKEIVNRTNRQTK